MSNFILENRRINFDELKKATSFVTWNISHHHLSGFEDEKGLCSMGVPFSHHCAEAEACGDMPTVAAAVQRGSGGVL